VERVTVKTALIVGGDSSTIGKSIIARLLDAQYQVVATSRETMHTSGAERGHYHLDIRDEAAVRSLIDTVNQRYGAIDALVNNAGVLSDSLAPVMKTFEWHRVLDTDLTGIFYTCKYTSRKMIAHGHGKIVNIASTRGIAGSPGQSDYSAVKAGVIALTKSLAMELAPFRIAVNAICPGFIPSGLNQHNAAELKGAQEASLLDLSRNLQDVANFVAYMCSDEIQGVSGQVSCLDSRIVDWH
jgi:3-oxoacyl-[acyl-carrier protein] reductase